MAVALQPGAQGIGHREAGELGRRVMAAAAAPFLGGLKHQAAGGLHALEQAPIDPWRQRCHQFLLIAGLLEGLGRLGWEIRLRLLFQPGLAFAPG